MQPAPRVDLFAPLRASGITYDLLLEAVIAGERQGRDQTHSLHPANYPGLRFHAETTAALRSLLQPHWKPVDICNQSRTVSRDGLISLVVMSGDERTGLLGDPQPRARHDKGGVTQRSAQSNASQLRLFSPEILDQPHQEGTQLWVLLVARIPGRNGEPDTVRFEVSLPTAFDRRNISEWTHRELFPPAELDTPPSIGKGPTDDSDPEDLPDIPVIRRK